MKGLDKLFAYLVLIMIVVCMNNLLIYAQEYDFLGDAGDGTYTVTMKKVEISQDNSTWVTLAEGEKSFNIASKAVGETIDSYISNVAVPAGTYNYLRITQSRTITIQGQGSNGGTTYYTTTQNGKDPGGTFYKAITDAECIGGDCVVSGEYEAVPFQVPADASSSIPGETLTISGDDMIIVKDMTSTPLVFVKGQSKSMSLSFKTASMIGFKNVGGNIIFFPMPPQQIYSEE